MCEEACPVDAIELTSLFDLTGFKREEMIFDKEKLLSVFDETVKTGKDPIRPRPPADWARVRSAETGLSAAPAHAV